MLYDHTMGTNLFFSLDLISSQTRTCTSTKKVLQELAAEGGEQTSPHPLHGHPLLDLKPFVRFSLGSCVSEIKVF